MTDNMKVAVVTGGNRGIGFEVCRQLAELGWLVVLSARNFEKAQAATKQLSAQLKGKGELIAAELDITNTAQAWSLAEFVEEQFGRLDSLVNNAGGIFEEDSNPPALDADLGQVWQSIDTNALGALRVTQAFAPLLKRDGGGTLVNVSSRAAQFATMTGGHAGYRMSKAALNALTLMFHSELSESGVRANSVCPGFVRSEISPINANAPLAAADGAKGIVWAATLGPDGPSGGFFHEGERVEW